MLEGTKILIIRWDEIRRAGRELLIRNFQARFYQICERVGNDIFVNLHISPTINRFIIDRERKNTRPHKKRKEELSNDISIRHR